MNILIVVPSFYPAFVYGGPIYSIYYTCKALAKCGTRVRVSTTNANGNKKLDVQPNCLQEIESGLLVKYYDDIVIGRLSFCFIINVWRDVLSSEIVHLQDIFSTYIPPTLFFAKLFGRPLLISPRGALSSYAIGSKRSLAKRLWLRVLINPFVRGVTWHATSLQERGDILSRYPQAEVVVIPNGINASEQAMSSKADRQAFVARFVGVHRPVARVIVSLGRLHPVKGFDLLIQGFHRLLRDFPDSVLLIAGHDDGEKCNLDRLIQSLSLSQNAFLVGELRGKDKLDFLAGGDLFVLPSHSENFGNVYLEAMAAGMPIIASKGTPWQVIEEVGCGKWIDNSVEAIYLSMRDLLLGDVVSMGRRARAFAARFDWDRIGEQFQLLYADILRKNMPGTGS